MKSFFYTSDALMNIFKPASGSIDWERYGFDPYEVLEAVKKGFQQPNPEELGEYISILPIHDMEQFQPLFDELTAANSGKAYEIIEEEEANRRKSELEGLEQVRQEKAARTAPLSDSEKLDLLIEAQADLIGGAL